MADSVRLQALKNLSNQLPVANSQLAAGQAASRDMQLQNAVKAAPAATNITQASQQTGAATAQNAGQQFIQNAAATTTQQGQIGGLGNQATQQQNQSNVASLQQGSKEQSLNNEERFARVSEAAKKQLYDKQMQFQKDELGRTKFNEIQLADYARANAKSDEEFKNYASTAQQASQRNLQAMETAYNKIVEDLTMKYKSAEQAADQKSMEDITKMKIEADRRMAEEKARAANNAAMWTAGGTIVGATAGAVFGGPAGAMAGGAAGGALGGIAASQM